MPSLPSGQGSFLYTFLPVPFLPKIFLKAQGEDTQTPPGFILDEATLVPPYFSLSKGKVQENHSTAEP